MTKQKMAFLFILLKTLLISKSKNKQNTKSEKMCNKNIKIIIKRWPWWLLTLILIALSNDNLFKESNFDSLPFAIGVGVLGLAIQQTYKEIAGSNESIFTLLMIGFGAIVWLIAPLFGNIELQNKI
ncbi:MAG: hypothetical protein WC607_02810, partial [Candidatus Micrarchaeia archaeon]